MAYLHGTTIKVTPLHPDGRVRPEHPVVQMRDVRDDEEWRYRAGGKWHPGRPANNDNMWVEVRKATPTEIVPWHEAAGRLTVSGDRIVDVTRHAGGNISYTLWVEGRHDRTLKGALVNDRKEFTVRVED